MSLVGPFTLCGWCIGDEVTRRRSPSGVLVLQVFGCAGFRTTLCDAVLSCPVALISGREVARRCGWRVPLRVLRVSCFRFLDAALMGVCLVERALFDRRFICSDLNVEKKWSVHATVHVTTLVMVRLKTGKYVKIFWGETKSLAKLVNQRPNLCHDFVWPVLVPFLHQLG